MKIIKMLGSALLVLGFAMGLTHADEFKSSPLEKTCHHGDARVQADVAKDLGQENLINRFADLHREMMGQALSAPSQQSVYAQSDRDAAARTVSR